MKKSYKKRLMIIIGAILVFCMGVLIKLFLIGEPVDGEQVYCTTSVNDQELTLQIDAIESAMALRGWKYHQNGSTLQISVRKVPVSPFFDEGHYETTLDVEGVEHIMVGNKTIWMRKD